jgi:hypothetical protein
VALEPFRRFVRLYEGFEPLGITVNMSAIS